MTQCFVRRALIGKVAAVALSLAAPANTFERTEIAKILVFGGRRCPCSTPA